MSNIIDSIISEVAQQCQVGRDVLFAASPGERECAELPQHRLIVRTDTENLVFTLCASHRTEMRSLERAEDLIVIERI